MDWCRKNRNLLLFIILLSSLLIAGGVVYHYQSIFGKPGAFNYRNLIWFILIPLVALGYSYPLNPWNKKSLRQTGWLKMTSLSFIWSFTTLILPVLMFQTSVIEQFNQTQLLIFFVHRFFFIAALSFLFNINDHDEDKEDGIKTIAVLIGPAKSLLYGKWLMTFLNLVTSFFLLYCFELNSPVYYAALFIPVILLFILYQRFSPMKDEAVFAIRYDGLMIVKALLLIFALRIFSS